MATFMNCPLIYWDTLYLFYWDTLYLFYWDTLYLFYPMFTGIPCICSIPCLLGYPVPVLSHVYWDTLYLFYPWFIRVVKSSCLNMFRNKVTSNPGNLVPVVQHTQRQLLHGLNTNIIFIILNNNKKINKILKM